MNPVVLTVEQWRIVHDVLFEEHKWHVEDGEDPEFTVGLGVVIEELERQVPEL